MMLDFFRRGGMLLFCLFCFVGGSKNLLFAVGGFCWLLPWKIWGKFVENILAPMIVVWGKMCPCHQKLQSFQKT